MDMSRKIAINGQLDELAQNVLDSECDDTIKNLFSETVRAIRTVNDSCERAHERLDERKSEYQELLVEFKSLSAEVSKATLSQQEQTNACKKMALEMKRQVEVVNKAYKRQAVFSGCVIAITLMSLFGAVKGATTASSIWNVIKLLIP